MKTGVMEDRLFGMKFATQQPSEWGKRHHNHTGQIISVTEDGRLLLGIHCITCEEMFILRVADSP